LGWQALKRHLPLPERQRGLLEPSKLPEQLRLKGKQRKWPFNNVWREWLTVGLGQALRQQLQT
jgi:hypothetical protein